MAIDKFIIPENFINFTPVDYKREFKKSLKHLSIDKKELYHFLLVRNYYFKNEQKSDILLFIDVKKDKKWQALPFVKAIVSNDKVVDGETINKRYIKYITNSIYGTCKLAKVADFDNDGKDDYSIAIVTAFGRGASKDKALRLLNESKTTLFKGENVHMILDRDFEPMLRESREIKIAKKEERMGTESIDIGDAGVGEVSF